MDDQGGASTAVVGLTGARAGAGIAQVGQIVKGQWVKADEGYLNVLTEAFKAGFGDLPEGTIFAEFIKRAMCMLSERLEAKCRCDGFGMCKPNQARFVPQDVPAEVAKALRLRLAAARSKWEIFARHRLKDSSFAAPAIPVAQVQVQVQMQVQTQQVQVKVDNATLARESREAAEAAARREAELVAAAVDSAAAAAAKALAELRAELAASEAAAAAARAETAAVRVDLATQVADLDDAESALESTLADVAVISAEAARLTAAAEDDSELCALRESSSARTAELEKELEDAQARGRVEGRRAAAATAALGEQQTSYEERLKALAVTHEAELRACAGAAASDAAAEVERQQALAAEAAAARERAEASLAVLRDEHAVARAEVLAQAGKLAMLQACATPTWLQMFGKLEELQAATDAAATRDKAARAEANKRNLAPGRAMAAARRDAKKQGMFKDEVLARAEAEAILVKYKEELAKVATELAANREELEGLQAAEAARLVDFKAECQDHLDAEVARIGDLYNAVIAEKVAEKTALLEQLAASERALAKWDSAMYQLNAMSQQEGAQQGQAQVTCELVALALEYAEQQQEEEEEEEEEQEQAFVQRACVGEQQAGVM
jgi:hypothetical protein